MYTVLSEKKWPKLRLKIGKLVLKHPRHSVKECQGVHSLEHQSRVVSVVSDRAQSSRIVEYRTKQLFQFRCANVNLKVL